MKDNVAGLVERLEAYQEALSEVNPNARTFAEAASTIRALVAEIERLQGEAKIEAALLSEWMAAAAQLDAALREAVEMIRRWHMADLTGHDGSLSRARQVSEAFLATMEKPRDP